MYDAVFMFTQQLRPHEFLGQAGLPDTKQSAAAPVVSDNQVGDDFVRVIFHNNPRQVITSCSATPVRRSLNRPP